MFLFNFYKHTQLFYNNFYIISRIKFWKLSPFFERPYAFNKHGENIKNENFCYHRRGSAVLQNTFPIWLTYLTEYLVKNLFSIKYFAFCLKYKTIDTVFP